MLGIWAGGAGRGLDGPVRVLAAAFAVGTLSAGITAVLTGMGRPGDAARYKVVLMVTTIACTGVFGAAHGLEGIAEGAAAAQLVAILYLVCGPVANLGAHVRSELLRSLERPAAALVVASACGALAAVALRAGDAWTWSAAAVTLALYPVALLAVGGVTANDLRLLGYPARWNPPGVRTGAGG